MIISSINHNNEIDGTGVYLVIPIDPIKWQNINHLLNYTVVQNTCVPIQWVNPSMAVCLCLVSVFVSVRSICRANTHTDGQNQVKLYRINENLCNLENFV